MRSIMPADQPLPRLHIAAIRGETTRIRRFIDEGDAVDSTNDSGGTALLYATSAGEFNSVRTLLAAGANPSACANDGWFPLFMAVDGENVAIAKLLIEHGADMTAAVTPSSVGSGTPLTMAAWKGHKGLVKLLLDSGCDLEKMAAEEHVPLVDAVTGWKSHNNHLDIINMLLAAGANINAPSYRGVTPLHQASVLGCTSGVARFIEMGANVDSADIDANTPLHNAAGSGFDKIVNMLIRAGADVNKKNRLVSSPLHFASKHGYQKCVWFLLCAGARVSERDIQGLTALHAGCDGGHVEVIEHLLSAGADRNAQDDKGTTPLFMAAQRRQPKAVSLLIEAGANPHHRNAVGINALFVAQDLKVVQVLLEAGVSPKVVSVSGGTVFHHAAVHGSDAGAICALFKAGADPTRLNRYGQKPSDLARENDHDDTAKLLDLLAAKHRAATQSTSAAASAASGKEEETKANGASA